MDGNTLALMQSCFWGVKPDFQLGPPGRTEALIPRKSFSAAGQSPCEIEQPAAQGRVVDPVICADQLDGFTAAQRIGVERFGRRLGEPRRDRRRANRVHVVEEEGDRNVQHATEIMQPAGADPIGAALVFLDLLKGQSDRLPKLFLAEAEHVSAEPHAGADMDIDRVRLVAFSATRAPELLLHRHRWSTKAKQREWFDKAPDRWRSTRSVNGRLRVAIREAVNAAEMPPEEGRGTAARAISNRRRG